MACLEKVGVLPKMLNIITSLLHDHMLVVVRAGNMTKASQFRTGSDKGTH